MNLDFKHLLPQNFSPQSRVWIYQSSRIFSIAEALDIELVLNNFTAGWLTHGAEVKAYGNLFFGQFIVIMADETMSTVSGCSTDTSVRFIKGLEEKYRIDFLNRTNLAFIIKDTIQMLPISQLPYAFENDFINTETLYFNNMVASKAELESFWIIPVSQSWLATKIPIKNSIQY